VIEGWGCGRAFLLYRPGDAGAISGPSDLGPPLQGIGRGGLAGNVGTLSGAPALRAGHGGISFCSVVHDDAARR